MEPRRAKLVQDDVARQVELAEGIDGQNACAMDRRAACGVLFVERDVQPAARQKRRCVQTAWSAAHDDDISHPCQGHRRNGGSLED
jgi:hypothetical protein